MNIVTVGKPRLASDFIRIEKLITSKQWEAAATSGRIGYTTVMAHEEFLINSFGEDKFHSILSSCKDLPGF